MSQEPVLGESLAALSQFLVGDRTVEETLQQVAELAVEGVQPADLAGISFEVEGHKTTAVHTDELVPEIDDAQYAADDGPCLLAISAQEIVVVDSTSQPGPFPEFRSAAAERGIASSLSLPLSTDEQSLGALNLYSRSEASFTEEHRVVAEIFASHAAVVLANAEAYREAESLSRQLREAMEFRSVIEQAKGILMAAQWCGPEEAFDLLVAASQRENVKLREIAQRIVRDTMSKGEQHPA